MYLEHWKLQQKPFENTSDPDFFYFSPGHEEAYIRLLYTVKGNKGAALLTGDYGCGKTTLIRLLIRELPRDTYKVVFLQNPRRTPVGLLRDILYGYEVDAASNEEEELVRAVEDVFSENVRMGVTNVLFIDEAQLIEERMTFMELALLLNLQLEDRFLVTLGLVGQPELRERVAAVPQLDQRFFARCHLNALDFENTRKYILHRLQAAGREEEIFQPDAVKAIFDLTAGVPRRINDLCDMCLLVGFMEGQEKIDGFTVRREAPASQVKKGKISERPVEERAGPAKKPETGRLDRAKLEGEEFRLSSFPGLRERLKEAPPSPLRPVPRHPGLTREKLLRAGEEAARRERVPEKIQPPAIQKPAAPPKAVSEVPVAEVAQGIYREAQEFLSAVFTNSRAGQPFPADWGIQIVRDFLKTPGCLDALFRLASDPKGGNFPIGQSVNVAILSVNLGHRLNYGEKELVELGVAALFHNIGYSQLPEGLLEKAGSYSPAEEEVVRKHTYFGREILKKLGANFLIASTVAYQSHEREGGQGYPQGLKGDEIHEYAKIVGIVDVFEALIHRRPHRPPFPPFRAIRTIIEQERDAFSPKVIKALVATVSLFPLYSYVRLNSNAIGQVVEVSDAFPLRPAVRLVVDQHGKRLTDGNILVLRDSPLLYVTDALPEEDLP